MTGVLSSIKIGSRVWKLGESITSIGTTAVSKSKLRESFGDQWAQANLTGILLGKGANKKVRVRWTNLKDTEDMEYGYNHRIFANPLSALCLNGRKSVPVAPLEAGAGATLSMSIVDLRLTVSSTSTDQSSRKARLEDVSHDDQLDSLSASRSEVSGMKRKRVSDEVDEDENPRKEFSKKGRDAAMANKCRVATCKECGGSAYCNHGRWKRIARSAEARHTAAMANKRCIARRAEARHYAATANEDLIARSAEARNSAATANEDVIARSVDQCVATANCRDIARSVLRLQPRQVEKLLQGVWRLGVLQPRQAKDILQGVWRLGILQPRQMEEILQGVRRLGVLQPRQAKGTLQGVPAAGIRAGGPGRQRGARAGGSRGGVGGWRGGGYGVGRTPVGGIYFRC